MSIEHREEFPELLPDLFYQYASSVDRKYPPAQLSEFYRAEYRKYPTAMNAFLTAYVTLSDGAEDQFKEGNFYFDSELRSSHKILFEEYHAAGILDTFLKIVMPEEGLTPVTRTNLPNAPDRSPVSADTFWERVSKIPRGETYLLWTAHAKTLKAHFREKFAEAYAERLSKEEAMKR